MIDKKLLRKYFEGKCTPEEARSIHLLFAGKESDLSAIKQLLDESWEESTEEIADATQSTRIITSLRNKLYPAPAPVVRLSRFRRRWISYAAAAAVLLCVAGAVLWQQYSSHPAKEVAMEWETLTNPGTKSRYVVLPDSSRIWLTPGATLQYVADFTRGERKVRLNGEAFFDVAHRQTQPFIVYNGDIATKVLGTAFNIEAYTREATIRVSLVRGKVAVQDSLTTTTLQAGEMLVYDKRSKAVTKETLKMTDIGQWTKGYTIFNDVPVAAALERIAARYHKKLELGDQTVLAQRRVTTFFKEENMEEMLNLLLFVTQHSFRDDGETITIIKN